MDYKPYNRDLENIRRVRNQKIRNLVLGIIGVIICAIIAFYIVSEQNKNAKIYAHAEELLSNGDYAYAREEFEKCNTYKDAQKRILESYYLEGLESLNANNYDEAIELLNNAKGYSDAYDRIDICYYEKGNSLAITGEFEEARIAFRKAGSYSDASTRAEEMTYQLGMEQYYSGNYKEAIEILVEVMDYSDTVEIINGNQYLRQAYIDYTFEINKTIFFGSYEQDNDYSNGNEPIEWIILSNDGDEILLISKYVLDNVVYDHSNQMTWSGSYARKWLNSTFLDSAFNGSERSCLVYSHLEPTTNPDYGTVDQGSATDDLVFCLSYQETMDLCDRDSRYTTYTQSSYETRYTPKSKDAVGYYDWEAYWWTRTPGKSKSGVTYVRGIVFTDGKNLDGISAGIRPCIRVQLNTSFIRLIMGI